MAPFRRAILMMIALLVVSCATQRPVLYPNAHLQAVGDETAHQDIDRCIQRAKASGAESSKAGAVAGRTGVGAAVGAATGAVVGAITGSAGRSAAVGAAGGGTVGLVSSLFRTREPDPVFQRYIEQCLHDKGYHTIGWRQHDHLAHWQAWLAAHRQLMAEVRAIAQGTGWWEPEVGTSFPWERRGETGR